MSDADNQTGGSSDRFSKENQDTGGGTEQDKKTEKGEREAREATQDRQ